MALEELIKHAKKINKLAEKEKFIEAGEILSVLKRETMTMSLLKESKIGHAVNALRKSAQDAGYKEIATTSKALIKQWKAQMDGKSSGVSEKSAPRQESPPKNSSGVESSIQPTADPIRNKCREMIQNSLTVGPEKYSSQMVSLMAAKVEEAIYKLHGARVDPKYKNKIRSRYSNLKDPKNPELRASLMQGIITPERLASMKPEEMASKELTKLREKFTKEAINDHQMAQNEGTKTDMFTCGKCKAKECTYTQLQTRSADEPMTTFVYCMACGNRWKFC